MSKWKKSWSTESNRHYKQRLLRTSNLCGLCGFEIKTMKEVTIDHIIPISKGGSVLDVKNMQLAHEKCNASKGNKIE